MALAHATNHQHEFAAHCVGDTAQRALLDGAIALAWTGADRVSPIGRAAM
ncbi:hypothetical protein ACFWIJ_08115 [Streptomyces sp. NPDC127079]